MRNIPVTKPYFPPINIYQNYVRQIYDNEWLTNNGTLLTGLERKLEDRYKLNTSIVSNGTLALQFAIKALGLSGEIITTPFSYVATVSSIVWEGCKPIFVDIDKDTFNINHELIEDYITKETTAILATHVFGNPCRVNEIEAVAKKHGLKVIYDASHAFDISLDNRSLLSHGDVSVVSFHATKIFHMVEGGGVFSVNPEVIYRINQLRNFGHKGYEDFDGIGINGKNSELHSAMGHCVLADFELIASRRKKQYLLYQRLLKDSGLRFQKVLSNCSYNYSYFPIIFPDESSLVRVMRILNENNIFPRRYFYPLLNNLHYVDYQKMEVAESISSRVICLPLFHDLQNNEQNNIAHIILENLT
ncbi:MAG: dTDP-4-amino-4,6-dideoxygalactose transaminase [Marivirga sp.]|jgi:dTDP-4-amino-4,6-dideoxygalactose transaminase